MSTIPSTPLRTARLTLPPVVLLFAGVVATVVGLSLGAAPSQFYAGYGVTLGDSVSLHNEMRGTAGPLVAGGSVLVVSAFNAKLRKLGAAFGALLYVGYAAGRCTSFVLDGFPHPNLVYAAAVELVLGTACGWVYISMAQSKQ